MIDFSFVIFFILGLLLVALPFQLFGLISYLFSKNLTTSSRKWLTILTPAIIFCAVYTIMVINSSAQDAAGRFLGQVMDVITYILGTIINIALSFILFSFLSRRKNKLSKN